MTTPRTLVAGDREAGTICAHCGRRLNWGEKASICQDCGGIHHEMCWQINRGCAAYECRPAVRTDIGDTEPLLKVTPDQLATAEPLAPRKSFADGVGSTGVDAKPKKWSRTSIGAFVIAMLGIPLFGLVTGLVAIVVGCIALAGHTSRRRGFSLAVVGILLGLADVVGWGVGLAYYLEGPAGLAVRLDDSPFDRASLDGLPEPIGRAMRANVLVESSAGLLHRGMGSGVILKIEDNSALIVTNRHVIDSDYSDSTTKAPQNLADLGSHEITTVDQMPVPATVEWVAPHGIDLAILRAPILSPDAQEAHWDLADVPHIGESVFAIGNPLGLGWTHTSGEVSQFRPRSQGPFDYRILQTTAAINPGNSGGGLYNERGRLIGLNTLTGDKRFAEGLGFAISISALMELVPDRLKLGPQNPSAEAE